MSTISYATLNDILKENITSVLCFAIRVIFKIDKAKYPGYDPTTDPDNTPENGITVINEPTQWIVICRFINDTVNHQFNEKYFDDNGNVIINPTLTTYLGLPFEVSLPTYEESQPPTTVLTMVNPGYDIISFLRRIMVRPRLELSLVAIRTPPVVPTKEITVEIGPLDLTVTQMDWDDAQIRFTLSFDYLYLMEPFMVYKFTPEYFPGLFSWST